MVVFADVFGVVNIAHVENHIFVATRECKQVIVGGENVVDAAGQSVVVLRRHFRMCGFRQVEDHHAVSPVRRALSRNCSVPSVRRDLHIVQRPGVHLNGVGLEDVAGIGNVPHKGVALCLARSGERVVAPIHTLEQPKITGVVRRLPAMAHHVHPLDNVSLHHRESAVGREGPGRCHHGVHAGYVGNDLTVVYLTGSAGSDDACGGLERQGPRDGNVVDDTAPYVARNRRKVLHVTAPHLVPTTNDLQPRCRKRFDQIVRTASDPIERRRNRGSAGALAADVSVSINRGDPRV